MAIDLHERYPDLPGTLQLPPPPRELFESLRQRRGPSYRPRTRHLNPDGSALYTNRLFLESSPYLLQHAHNPVNWFPWGNEPFDLARELRRPVLVSIGYATCHWCHVMEEESFENEEIARFLNEHYLAIKVDREERPDVDTVYMTALHAMGAQGGWPLNVFVTPDRQPFYGGTYFPPFDHSRGIGFLSLLKRLLEAFRSDPQRVTQAGEQLTMAVRDMLQPAQREEIPLTVSLEKAVLAYRDRFDSVNGGLAGAPKFPSSLPVRLLLRSFRQSGEPQLLHMAELTLRRMAQAGIYDQVAGGFHRYATDERWMIPHFEKMLYDNAQLPLDYLDGYQATGNPYLAEVAGDVLRYLQRDLASPQGAFYAATDADSLAPNGKREEGYFFTWTPGELAEVLGKERGALVAALYGVTEGGNFEGRSILHQARSSSEVAREMKLPEEGVRLMAEESRELLYEARKLRPLPLRDEKILSSWNGLALSAFARGGLILKRPAAIEQARVTADFLLHHLTKDGRLAHSYQEGGAKGEGFLDDYAFVIAGLIDLFQVTGEARWLQQSLALNEVVQEEFHDEAGGGYYMTGGRHEALIAREKPGYDGVVPSGNSMMAMDLLRLNALTEEPAFLDRAKRTMEAFAAQLSAAPTALSHMLLALDFLLDVPTQVVVVAPRGNRGAAQLLLDRLRAVFLPNCVLVCVSEGEELERAAALAPLLRDKEADGDRARTYLCRNRTCQLPTSDPEEFGRQLKDVGRGGTP